MLGTPHCSIITLFSPSCHRSASTARCLATHDSTGVRAVKRSRISSWVWTSKTRTGPSLQFTKHEAVSRSRDRSLGSRSVITASGKMVLALYEQNLFHSLFFLIVWVIGFNTAGTFTYASETWLVQSPSTIPPMETIRGTRNERH